MKHPFHGSPDAGREERQATRTNLSRRHAEAGARRASSAEVGRKLPSDALPLDMEPRQDKRLYFLLNVAQQALRKRMDEEGLARTGLTSAQMGVLFYLAKHEGCLLKDLGRGLGVKNAAITGLVSRTERTGCIKRKASSVDGRATHLHLTAKGQRKLEEIKKLNDEVARELKQGFSESELETATRFLQHVVSIAKPDEEDA
jgi:DNA-binding MarR family transcriptional regulator